MVNAMHSPHLFGGAAWSEYSETQNNLLLNNKTHNKTMTTTHTKEIGFVGVDSGLLMIGDPCNFVGQNSDAQKRFADWPKFLSEHPAEHQMKYNRGHDGLGVAFQTTHGDGAYPVYIQQNEHGKARFAIVVMDGTPIEEIIK